MNILIYIVYFLITILSFRLFYGPTLQDKLLAMSVIQSLIIVIVCFYSVMYKISYYLDIALLLSLLSFAEIIAFSKLSDKSSLDFFKKRRKKK